MDDHDNPTAGKSTLMLPTALLEYGRPPRSEHRCRRQSAKRGGSLESTRLDDDTSWGNERNSAGEFCRSLRITAAMSGANAIAGESTIAIARAEGGLRHVDGELRVRRRRGSRSRQRRPGSSTVGKISWRNSCS